MSATADPTSTAIRYSFGVRKKKPDDGRELAQRERMRLATEMDLDDLQLGDGEGDREHRPGMRDA